MRQWDIRRLPGLPRTHSWETAKPTRRCSLETTPAATFHQLWNCVILTNGSLVRKYHGEWPEGILAVPCCVDRFSLGCDEYPKEPNVRRRFHFLFPGFRGYSEFIIKTRHSHVNVTQLVLGSGPHHQEAEEDGGWYSSWLAPSHHFI